MGRRSSTVWRAIDHLHRSPDAPIVLCIDVEPDPQRFDPANPPAWLGFERIVQMLPALRRRLSEATGTWAMFTWCLRMDPQVAETWGSPAWVAEEYGDELVELTEAGDELGLHTHVWRWEPTAGVWFADMEDPDWAEHCLEMALSAFETSFGRGCAVHRGGTHFLSGLMLSTLEKRGVAVDLTVEPGLAPLGDAELGAARGHTPDYCGVPTRPYRSTLRSFPTPDPATRTGPLLVPLLSGPRRRPPFRRMPISPGEPVNVFMARLAAALVRKPPILGLVIRSSDVLGSTWDVIEENLEHLARHRGMAFVTASTAAVIQQDADGDPDTQDANARQT